MLSNDMGKMVLMQLRRIMKIKRTKNKHNDSSCVAAFLLCK